MKRYAFKISIFLALMFILDRGFGLTMKYMQNHAKGGYGRHHNYILNETNENILIFGSSKAIHHYNPQILIDSLGMSCYNCGQDGNGIILFYGWWELMKKKHHPKMIIYDVNPSFDLLRGEDNNRYLGWLRSEYDNKDIKKVFEDIDPTEKYKMQSMMYRYNSKFLQNITDFFHPLFNISPNGYLPLNGEIDKMKIKESKNNGKEPSFDFDLQKISYMETFIKEAKEKGIQLFFVASPIWYGKDDAQFAPLKEICYKQNIPFYNYSNDPTYVHHNEMFKDGTHLNTYGADKFTKRICKTIKQTRFKE